MIQIGLKNTFREAAIKFCNRINVNPSLIGVHLIFFKNGEKIDVNDYKTLEQIGIKNYYIITVIDNVNIYGAWIIRQSKDIYMIIYWIKLFVWKIIIYNLIIFW